MEGVRVNKLILVPVGQKIIYDGRKTGSEVKVAKAGVHELKRSAQKSSPECPV